MLRSPKLQRVTAMSVPALLAANAMVLVLGLTGMTDSADPERVTYIRAADGTMQLVDPSSPEGSKAIAEAKERGDDVVTVDEDDAPPAVQSQLVTTTLPSVTVPGGTPGVTQPGGIRVPLPEVVQTVDDLGNTVDSIVDDATDLIDDTAGTDLGDTVDPVVDDLTDTLTTTVSTIVATVPEITIPTTTSTTAAPTTTTTAAPITVPTLVPIVGGTEIPTTLPALPGL